MLVNGLHTADFPDEDKSVMLRKPVGIFQMLVNRREWSGVFNPQK